MKTVTKIPEETALNLGIQRILIKAEGKPTSPYKIHYQLAYQMWEVYCDEELTLDDLIDDLSEWEGPPDMTELWGSKEEYETTTKKLKSFDPGTTVGRIEWIFRTW